MKELIEINAVCPYGKRCGRTFATCADDAQEPRLHRRGRAHSPWQGNRPFSGESSQLCAAHFRTKTERLIILQERNAGGGLQDASYPTLRIWRSKRVVNPAAERGPESFILADRVNRNGSGQIVSCEFFCRTLGIRPFAGATLSPKTTVPVQCR